MTSRHPSSRRRDRSEGFTLVELLVTLVIVSLTLGAAITLFNQMNRLSRVQLHAAELQQSVRVAQREMGRVIQMAGRGGLAGTNNVGPAYDTPALSIRDNVGQSARFSEREIAIGTDEPVAVEGTDILTVRGVFDSSIWHLNYTDITKFDPVAQIVMVGNRTPTGIPQDLGPIKDACDPPDGGAARPEALILVNSANENSYAVLELDCSQTDHAAIPDTFDPEAPFQEIAVAYKLPASGGNAVEYQKLSPGEVLPNLASGTFNPSFLGLLEEYRFYVREQCRAGDGSGDVACDEAGAIPAHRLSMARMYPHTETPHAGDDDNLQIDVADSIFDLQLALGFDSSYDGNAAINGFFAFDADNDPGDGSEGDDDAIVESADGTSDDWMFNATGDAATLDSLPWSPTGDPLTFTASQPQPQIYYLRLSTLGFAARPDNRYSAPVVTGLEDRVYTTDPDDPLNGTVARNYRRELIQTVIDLRNLG
ncbi:MAG: prepilin-type N-terminal cleavage/methylation domain-containing protein [Thermoanaerobaculia bacterium]